MFCTFVPFNPAVDFIPRNANLEELRQASHKCQGCPLYQQATQTIFGEGSRNARLMLVGEQPGDQEDLYGKSFIGPAGQVLNKALEEVGISREAIYLTNAVKHFKFDHEGNKRIHRTPNLQDIVNCKPWLEKEIELIKPNIIVCLGVTAARALISSKFKQQESRGKFIHKEGILYLATYHPSAVLRSDRADEIYNTLVTDLSIVKQQLNISLISN